MDVTIKTKELTEREKTIVKLIALPTYEIADRLCVSENTIKTFKAQLRKKLNASNDTQILANALKRGVINLDEMETVEVERE